MPEPVIGVHVDSHGNTATITKDPPKALPELCAQVHQRLEAFLKAEPRSERVKGVQDQSRLSLKVLEEALERYSLDELSLSYNGGKDCLVLLVLYLSALHTHSTKGTNADDINSDAHPPPPRLPQTLRSVYIISPHPFKEVDDFVDDSLRTYHLDLARYAKPMKEAFADYLGDYKEVKAIFVGTRRTDPHGGSLKYFDPTDRGWPSFMRIHPVIDWHYAEIWTFIRELEIPYCPLYDMGYTSLGGTTDTHPNPALAVKDDPGGEKYRPAFELVEDEAERLGRDRIMVATGDAVSRVINTPELLENILLGLDETTLLLSQRVNNFFNATITGSSILQQKLFFRPLTAVDEGVTSKNQLGVRRNPIISRLVTINRGPCRATLHVSWVGYIVLSAAARTRADGEELRPGGWQRMLALQLPTHNHPPVVVRYWQGCYADKIVLPLDQTITLGDIVRQYWPEKE
ncbi:hypothetical protein LTR85_004596 [Meristemomyces frigidus]|nr:hypothetical protein LTR85_004596 [Meristemomyces frigidus]